jgi:hypothetical protein
VVLSYNIYTNEFILFFSPNSKKSVSCYFSKESFKVGHMANILLIILKFPLLINKISFWLEFLFEPWKLLFWKFWFDFWLVLLRTFSYFNWACADKWSIYLDHCVGILSRIWMSNKLLEVNFLKKALAIH